MLTHGIIRNPVRLTLALVTLGLLVIVCTLNSCRHGPRPEGLGVTDHDTNFTIQVNGRERDGKLHVPALYNGKQPHSLLFALHGAEQTGEDFQKLGFDRLADQLDFIVVYPNGIGRRWDSPDDTAFFQSMASEFKKKYNIDPNRLYVTGHSAGAFEAYELAVLLPGLFTAIAPVAGVMMSDMTPENLTPISLLHIHAINDQDVPYEGVSEWGMLSAKQSIDFWRRINGGTGIPIPDSVPMPIKTRDRFSSVFYDSRTLKGTLWKGSTQDTASLISTNAGHTWPPRATESIMDFLYNHPARSNLLNIDRQNLPITTNVGMALQLRSLISNPTTVRKVSYFSNGILIGETTKRPFAIDWKIPSVGVHQLAADATLNDGTVIHSTINPFVLASTALPESDTEKDAKPSPSGGSSIPIVTARSSSNEAKDIEAPNAVDNDFFTRWSSEWHDDENLILDLGESHMVTGVTILWEMAYGKRYLIDLSTDARTWQRIVRESAGKGGIVFHSFRPTQARFVRFTGIERGTEWGYSFWEIFVHGE